MKTEQQIEEIKAQLMSRLVLLDSREDAVYRENNRDTQPVRLTRISGERSGVRFALELLSR